MLWILVNNFHFLIFSVISYFTVVLVVASYLYVSLMLAIR